MNAPDHSFWLSIVSLIAAGQGFFLALVLAGRKQNSLANHILSVAMLLFSLDLATTFYHGSGLDERYPHLIGTTYGFPFLYSPVFLLYAQALTGSIRRFALRHVAHFIPFVLVTLYTLPFYATSAQEKLLILSEPASNPWTEKLFFVDHLKFAYSLVYLVMILVVIVAHRRRVRDRFSSLDKVNLDWLRFLALGGLMTWTVSLIFYLVGYFSNSGAFDPIEGHADWVSLAVAAYVYSIGYFGLRQPEIFTQLTTVVDEETPAPASYAKSRIDDVQARLIEVRLLDVMQSAAPYRDPELTLPQLAEMLGITPHNLSQVVNSQLQKNFYDFVNGYRVEEVKRRILEDKNASLTLLSIGLDAGFNSKSSFNAVFKKMAGCTPSEFRRDSAGQNPDRTS
jgi:AraC-like DNA-binding protein